MKKPSEKSFKYAKLVTWSYIVIYAHFIILALKTNIEQPSWFLIIFEIILLPVFYFALITILSGAIEIVSLHKIKMEYTVLSINALSLSVIYFFIIIYLVKEEDFKKRDQEYQNFFTSKNVLEKKAMLRLINYNIAKNHPQLPYNIFFCNITKAPKSSKYNKSTYMAMTLYVLFDKTKTIYYSECFIENKHNILLETDKVFNSGDTSINKNLESLMKNVSDFRNYVRRDTSETDIKENGFFYSFDQ